VVPVGVVGIGLEDLLVKQFGLAQVASLVMLQCGRKHFGNGRHGDVPSWHTLYLILRLTSRLKSAMERMANAKSAPPAAPAHYSLLPHSQKCLGLLMPNNAAEGWEQSAKW